MAEGCILGRGLPSTYGRLGVRQGRGDERDSAKTSGLPRPFKEHMKHLDYTFWNP